MARIASNVIAHHHYDGGVSQPTFAPVSVNGEVRPTASTATPELGRAPKAGLQRHAPSSAFAGTPAPNEGYALTLAAHGCAALVLPVDVDHHDVEIAVALLAAKRASVIGRAPTIHDVRAVIELLELNEPTTSTWAPLAGLAHSYAAQRTFTDGFSSSQLLPIQ